MFTKSSRITWATCGAFNVFLQVFYDASLFRWTVTRGEEVFILSENESTYIPLGTRHRLENPGTIPLEIIEVQSGSYLGEDDIVRFEDVYARC